MLSMKLIGDSPEELKQVKAPYYPSFPKMNADPFQN